MTADLTLRVISPDRIVVDTRATSVRLPGVDGSLGILPRHAAMVAALDIGVLRYVSAGEEHVLFLSGGFAEVHGSTVRVVSEAGERPEEIDEERARAAEERARKHLDEAHGPGRAQIDVLRAEMALRRAQMRLYAKRGYGRTLV